MKEIWNYDACVEVIKREIEALKKIFLAQDNVRQGVLAREWADFEEKTEDVKNLGEEFAALEEERARLFNILDSDESKPFYAKISGLPFAEQRELSRLYRELKMETLKIKALNDNFMAYLNEAKAVASAYIEAVYPARGGKMYTRNGSKVSQDLKSMVFNSQF